MSSSVRKKASNDGVGVDRISNLPDPILINILSLLPTHVAVTTSILSTKWKFLWKNIFNLTLDDLDWHRRNLFYDDSPFFFRFFVNNLLASLNEQSIEHFYLRIHKNNEQYDVNSWISAAISKNAKVIEFVDKIKFDDIEILGRFFTSETLEVLRLSNCNLNLPSLISLPNLKTLSLINPIEDSISKLISGCLSLQNLDISDLSHENVPIVTILSPTLQNLSLIDFRTYGFDDNNNKIVINAPQLRYLNLDRVKTINFSVENLCLLDEAHINLLFDKFFYPLLYDHYSKGVLKLVQGLYNVNTLSLGLHTFEALSHGGVIPKFSRLSKLTVEVRIHLKSLINLLESCDELQSLTLSLDKTHDFCEELATCWSEPEKVPVCFLSSLHIISMHGVKDHLFEMIAYMLQNAKVLRTIKLQAYDINANEKLLQEIPNIPRRSEICQVIFLNPMN